MNITAAIGSIGGDIVGRDKIVGFSAAEVRRLIRDAVKGASEKLEEVSRQLGVTQGLMRLMLATVDKADIPDERLSETLWEVFEENRRAASVIATLNSDNPIAQGHLDKASEAARSGDHNEARRRLRAARAEAEAAVVAAQRVAKNVAAAAAGQMIQAARVAAAEAYLALTELDYEEAARRRFAEASSLLPAEWSSQSRPLLRRAVACRAAAGVSPRAPPHILLGFYPDFHSGDVFLRTAWIGRNAK